MPQGGVRVEGLNRVVRALQGLGLEVEDLVNAFTAIATEAAQRAARHVNSRSGRLAGNIRGSKSKNKAVVRAGGAAVPYAGPINYSWPARHIAGQQFLQKADQEMQPIAVQKLELDLEAAIARKGLR